MWSYCEFALVEHNLVCKILLMETTAGWNPSISMNAGSHKWQQIWSIFRNYKLNTTNRYKFTVVRHEFRFKLQNQTGSSVFRRSVRALKGNSILKRRYEKRNKWKERRRVWKVKVPTPGHVDQAIKSETRWKISIIFRPFLSYCNSYT
jgi:hypothetical protein